ncbi:beta strand repeat-containing protein [Paludisphaera borealis]|nr:right-handed parallel beta-helix repeat-containing protein [Paludisphaera borealis]
MFEERMLLATFTVVNNGDSGLGSLRQAILDANAAAGLDSIEFNASLGVITPATALPPITGQTSINTLLQTGVVIDGNGGAFDGLTLGAGANGSSIQGLTIRNFKNSIIHVQSSNNTIAGNTLGGSPGADQIGVFIDGGSSNTIGGTTAGSANTIGFSTTAGVQILGASATSNVVAGNFIGTDGTNANRGNAFGVQIVNSSGNTIGGAAGNTIGFNTTAGVSVLSGAQNVVSQNLYVGTNGAATPVPASDINLGPTGNNGQPAPSLATATLSAGDLTLQFAIGLPAGTSVTVEVYQLTAVGVAQRSSVAAKTTTTVAGVNTLTIPTPGLANGSQVLTTATVAANGTSVFSNVLTIGASSYTVTNTDPSGPGSLFDALTSANASSGGVVPIDFLLAPGSVINVSAASPLPTITHPVDINSTNAPGITIAGIAQAVDGFILGAGSGGSTIRGLTIQNFAGAGVHVYSGNNTIVGDVLGTSGALNAIGILIDGGSSNIIGGLTAAAANTISFNTTAGIQIQGASATANVVEGNRIGGDGTSGNPGNGFGVLIVNSSGNTIGGAANGAANSIGFNTTAGVNILSGTGNVVSQNLYLGTNGPATPVFSSDITLLPGANNGQPAPTLITAAVKGGQVTIQYRSNVPANTPLTLELYQLDKTTGDRVFVASKATTTQTNGGVETLAINAGLANGDQILATSTGTPANGTSVFSNLATIADLYTVSNTQSSGPGSLFQALTNVNLVAGLGGPPIEIVFNLPANPGQVIDVSQNPLPTLAHAVKIAPSFTALGLVIDGGNTALNGIVLGSNSDGSTIQGLTIRNFKSTGILVLSSSNAIGGSAPEQENKIDSNGTGIELDGASNTLVNNYIGTAPQTTSGQPAFSNAVGILILGSNNQVGGTTGVANIIQSSSIAAIQISGSTAVGNRLQQNLVTQNLQNILLTNGANRNQNSVVLESAFFAPDALNPTLITVTGTFTQNGDLPQGGPYHVEIFAQLQTADKSLIYSPAAIYLGTFDLGTNQQGFSEIIAITPQIRNVLTAFNLQIYGVTATVTSQSAGTPTEYDTSAFSNSVRAVSLYTVTNTQDYNAGDDPILGSLRFALTQASQDGKQIDFAIPQADADAGTATTWTIKLNSTIIVQGNAANSMSGIVVDGLTQTPNAGTPVIQIDGQNTAEFGLEFLNASFVADAKGFAQGVTVRGLSFYGFKTAALDFNNVQNAWVVDNYIGLDAQRSKPKQQPEEPARKQSIGVLIEGGSTNINVGLPGFVSIAGIPSAAANYIGGNDEYGVQIKGETTQFNIVAGNFIGTDGEANLANGIGVLIDGSPNNTVGGVAFVPGGTNLGINQANVIGFNSGAGIKVDGAGSKSNSILGNSIGVNPFNPTKFLPANGVGVWIADASTNFVGRGDDPHANVIGNNKGGGVLISGESLQNLVQGNYLGTDRDFNPLGNANGVDVEGGYANLIGGRVDGSANFGANTIGFNKNYGVYLAGGAWNLVQGNFIGTNAKGAALGNLKTGVYVSASDHNIIGPSPLWAPGSHDETARNVISSNVTNGVWIVNANDNLVAGNLIGAGRIGGVNFSGNMQIGVAITGGAGNVVGGPMVDGALATGVANTIVGNGTNGVEIGEAATHLSSPKIEISTAATLPNLVQGNQIARNIQNGVHVVGDMTGDSTIAWIFDNFIGTDSTGTTVYDDNDRTYGNGLSGVLLEESSTKLDTSAAAPTTPGVYVAGNVISGNGLSGITAQQGIPKTDDQGKIIPGQDFRHLFASIVSNILGLDAAGANSTAKSKSQPQKSLPLGNILDGIRISDVVGVCVGSWTDGNGQQVGGPNVISGNLGRGVEIVGQTVNGLTGVDPLDPKFSISGYLVNGNVISGNKIGTDAAGTPGSTVAGVSLGNLSDGIFLFTPGNTLIRGNLIAGNRAAGVHAATVDSLSPANVTIDGNRIGSNEFDQTLANGNGSDGVFLDKMQNVTIRGNTISQNRANGVTIADSTTGIRLVGNTIGSLDPNVLGNSANGVFVNGSGLVTIGGATSGESNVISGNQASGIVISKNDGGYHGNIVTGNKIGVGADGATAVPNNNSGIIVSLSSNNVIGWSTAAPGQGLGNQISGNQLYGVLIAGNPDYPGLTVNNTIQGNVIGADSFATTAKAKLGNSSDGVFLLNAPSNTIGGLQRSQGNVISGNKAQGVRIFGGASHDNLVANNFIGVDSTGSTAVANGGNGVILDNAGYNLVGYGNIISGNQQSGVMVSSTTQSGAGSVVAGNLIGLDAMGAKAIPNNASGVLIFGSSYNGVVNNFISGNALDGVQIFSPGTGAKADSNFVGGNSIGADWSGARALGNQGDGVHIINGSNNTIGGGVGGNRNVISGNLNNGVTIDQQTNLTASQNRIDGNLIGTDSSGFAPLGNGHFGVLLNNATGNFIGNAGQGSFVSTTAPRTPSNVISGNREAGVELTGTAGGNTILGNFIGVSKDGTAYNSNQQGWGLFNPIGVVINANASYNMVGGSTPGSGNIITQSSANPNDQNTSPTSETTYIGVEIISPTAAGNVIQGNMIGLDAKGQVGFNSIGVLLNNSVGTVVGGYIASPTVNPSLPSVANLISGNSLAGIEITGQLATGNQIYNNYIGTDVTGDGRPGLPDPALPAPPRNPTQASGVLILQGTQNTVGASESGNVIGGNGNVISGNGIGINIANQSGSNVKTSTNWIQGNRIGTDRTGTKANPNFEFGVFITASANNVIDKNLISANGLAGVEIFGGATQLASSGAQGTAAGLGTVLTGNHIGVDINDQVAFAVFNGTRQIDSLANHPVITLPDGIQVNYGFQQHGVVIIGASDNAVGLPGRGNRISGNIQTGVYISRRDNAKTLYALPTNNVVQANDLSLNGIYGVFRYDAPAGNPVIESPAANANTFTGTPIPIGDYVTGFNQNTPPSQQPQSILIAGPNSVTGATTTTGAAGSGRPRRAPVALHPRTVASRTNAKPTSQLQAKALSTTGLTTSRLPRVPQLIEPGSKARRVAPNASTSK